MGLIQFIMYLLEISFLVRAVLILKVWNRLEAMLLFMAIAIIK